MKKILEKNKDNSKVESVLTSKEWKKLFSKYDTVLNSNGFLLNAGSMFVNDPYLLNQRIKGLKSAAVFLDRERIEEAIVNIADNEQSIRNATHSMFNATYPLYRLQMLYEGILTYDSYMKPLYVDKKDMDTPRFKSDSKFIDMWHKKLNPKKQFRRIVAEVLAEGKKAYYIRQGYNSTTNKEQVDYVYFQELPSDWYKIVKHSTDSYAVVAFNFAYFWQAGTSLGQFPPIFTEYYEELMSATDIKNNGTKYIERARTPEDVVVEYNEETLTWYYWKELPANECFVFSFTEANDYQVSPFASLLLQAQDLSSYSLLQQQLLSVPLYSILLGELPINTDAKSGDHVDDFQLSPDSTLFFEEKINNSLPPGVSYYMTPSKENDLHHFQEVPNANTIYNMGLQQMINTAGVSTLMTTTEKPSVAQVKAGQITEVRYIDRVYEQFSWAINIILEDMYNIGDLKYLWNIEIFGDAFSKEKEKEELMKSLSLGQTYLLPKYMSMHNISINDAITMSDWVDSVGLYGTFKPLVNTFTSTENDDSGRPEVDDNDIESDATAASKDIGMNTGDLR